MEANICLALKLEKSQKIKIPDFWQMCADLYRVMFPNIAPEEIDRQQLALDIFSTSLINLDERTLPSVPAALQYHQNINFLRLNGNQLTEIPHWLPDMEGICVHNNPLQPNAWGSIPYMEKLKAICLRELSLTEIPDFIQHKNKLTILILSENQLTEIPDYIGSLENMEMLDFSHNKISQLPENLQELSKLEYLSLSSNYLQNLPDIFGKMTGLKTLDLSHNQLTVLPPTFFKLQNLTDVCLENNHFSDSYKDYIQQHFPSIEMTW